MIIDMGEKALERGEMMFISCPSCGQDSDGATSWAVAVVNGKDNIPVVSNLVCTECTFNLPITYGVIND